MSTNPIKANIGDGKQKSPTDPWECCEWANARLQANGDFSRHWVVTDNPKQPVVLVRMAVGQG